MSNVQEKKIKFVLLVYRSSGQKSTDHYKVYYPIACERKSDGTEEEPKKEHPCPANCGEKFPSAVNKSTPGFEYFFHLIKQCQKYRSSGTKILRRRQNLKLSY